MEFRKELYPCAIDWKHGFKTIDIVASFTLLFQPLVLQKLLLFAITFGVFVEGIKVWVVASKIEKSESEESESEEMKKAEEKQKKIEMKKAKEKQKKIDEEYVVTKVAVATDFNSHARRHLSCHSSPFHAHELLFILRVKKSTFTDTKVTQFRQASCPPTSTRQRL